MCLRSGNFKDFYLCVFAALSNVSQTYVDSLNQNQNPLTAQNTGVLFIAELYLGRARTIFTITQIGFV